MEKIKIVVVDDHKLVREMWRELFFRNEKIEVTGEAGTFDEAIEIVKLKRPDIVLLDINLSNASGFDAVPLIKKYSPSSKVIAVSMHSQPSYAKKMFGLGAKGYVTKNSSRDEIISAVEEVTAGRTYLCQEIKTIVSTQVLIDNNSTPGLSALSLREVEVIKLLKQGLTSKEVAAKLSISVRTAEVHRANILKKLKLKNTAALITFIQNSDIDV